MERLREDASGKFISAAKVGIYTNENDINKAQDLGRTLQLA